MDMTVDPFVEMVRAVGTSGLKLMDFHPRAKLVGTETVCERPFCPVIDFHNHLDSQEPRHVLRIMDCCDVERTINITMRTGETALEIMRSYHAAAPDRFATMAWMEWSGLHESGFERVAAERLERLVDSGVCGIKLWKDLGLTLRDRDGALLRVDDGRLDRMYAKAGELRVPVMFHTADPAAFFDPVDGTNERYEELAAHPEWSFHGALYGKRELLEQRNNVFARHPGTVFVGAHVGESPEDLDFVEVMLSTYPNVYVDMSARVAELGRQPRRAAAFFMRFADRILFGTDLLPDVQMYRLHYRFLQTADEYFDYPSHASRQGRWKIHGLHLPHDLVGKVYRENALKLLSMRDQRR